LAPLFASDELHFFRPPQQRAIKCQRVYILHVEILLHQRPQLIVEDIDPGSVKSASLFGHVLPPVAVLTPLASTILPRAKRYAITNRLELLGENRSGMRRALGVLLIAPSAIARIDRAERAAALQPRPNHRNIGHPITP
jgi:hypothetical protein